MACYFIFQGMEGLITGKVHTMASSYTDEKRAYRAENLLNPEANPIDYYFSTFGRIAIGSFLLYFAIFGRPDDE